jgi:hypothetical protein
MFMRDGRGSRRVFTHTVALKTDMRNLGNGKSSLLKQIPTMLKA